MKDGIEMSAREEEVLSTTTTNNKSVNPNLKVVIL
jgi:hypothetical protein